MTQTPSQLWTIDELSAQAALALSAEQPDMPSGRIREIPDARTIRYYTTLGLIDRPAQMRGRTALYGQRHLLQLVAIKRLQARGRSLSEIQERLLGQSDKELLRLAELPAMTTETPAPAPTESREAFWAEPPAPSRTPTEFVEAGGSDFVWQGLSLEEGVVLLFEPDQALDQEDISALRSAAAPLLKLLRTRRLLRGARRERGTP